MTPILLYAFSLRQWWTGAFGELVRYFDNMNITQWGIVASLFVVAGFMMLRTNNVRR